MSERRSNINKGLKLLASSFGPECLFDGVVEAVDNDAYTCDVVRDDDGSTEFDCRLRATATGAKSIDVLPKVGTAVVIAKMGAEEYLVLACDEISSYRVTVGNMVFTIDQNGFGVGNGGDSLKRIMTDMVNGILSVYAPKDVANITLLLNRINELMQ